MVAAGYFVLLRPYYVPQQSNRNGQRPRPFGSWLAWLCAPVVSLLASAPAHSQSAATQVHLITQAQPILLAQAFTGPSPGVLPTDATKTGIIQERALIDPGWRLRFNQILPARLYFNIQTEITQRLDTNVFLNYKKPQPDFVFRVQPNVNVGYNIFSNTAVYASYFSLKDNYMTHNRHLSEPVTQSLQMGIRHTMYVPKVPKLSLTLDMGARELWQSKRLRQSDLIPSFSGNYFFTPHTLAFATVLLQMRGQSPFVAPTREIDPFYTAGFVTYHGPWSVSVTDTFVTNFREPHFRHAIPAHGNVSMIADFEIDRAYPNHIPGLQTFIRAEPVFNWRSDNVVGLSGFDFRLYGGMRMSLSKQSQLAMMNQIKKSLQQQDGDVALKKNKKKGKPTPGASPTQNPDGTPATPPAPSTTDTKNTGYAPLIQPGLAIAPGALAIPPVVPAENNVSANVSSEVVSAPSAIPAETSSALPSVSPTAPSTGAPAPGAPFVSREVPTAVPTFVPSSLPTSVPNSVPTAVTAPTAPTASTGPTNSTSLNSQTKAPEPQA